MRRGKATILIVSVVVVVGVFFGAIAIKSYMTRAEDNLKRLAALPLSDVDLSRVGDGVYSGTYEAFPIAAEVKASVRDHRIAAIELVKHRTGQGAPAEAICGKVVEAQTLHVDAVAGATSSSRVIQKAIETPSMRPARSESRPPSELW